MESFQRTLFYRPKNGPPMRVVDHEQRVVLLLVLVADTDYSVDFSIRIPSNWASFRVIWLGQRALVAATKKKQTCKLLDSVL